MESMSSPSRKLNFAEKASITVRAAAAGIVAGTITPFVMYRTFKRDALADRPRSRINWERIGAHIVESGLMAVVAEELANPNGRKDPGHLWTESEMDDPQVH